MSAREDRGRANDAMRHLPLKPNDLLILLSLLDAEHHGYALLREIECTSDGAVRLDAGNLYRSLRRLLRDELVQRRDARPAPDSEDERRRYYRLTALGRSVVGSEMCRLQGLLADERARRLLAEAGI